MITIYIGLSGKSVQLHFNYINEPFSSFYSVKHEFSTRFTPSFRLMTSFNGRKVVLTTESIDKK